MGPAVRRTAAVLAVYGVLAVAALPALDAIRSVFLLPPLFVTLARWMLVAGALIAAAAAWWYPRLGRGGSDPDRR